MEACGMKIRIGTQADTPALAHLLWQFSHRDDAPARIDPKFSADFAAWIAEHSTTHTPFLALRDGEAAIGMAWLALVARVPRPDRMDRRSGDLQSVYVLPEHRNAGVGSALVAAVVARAEDLGLEHVSVHSNDRAVAVYERGGFAPTRRLMRWPRA
jgi:GNAT superfamily N-acetyltransferase